MTGIFPSPAGPPGPPGPATYLASQQTALAANVTIPVGMFNDQTLVTGGSRVLLIFYSGVWQALNAGGQIRCRFRLDGLFIGPPPGDLLNFVNNLDRRPLLLQHRVAVGAGAHTVDVRVDSVIGTNRCFVALEPDNYHSVLRVEEVTV